MKKVFSTYCDWAKEGANHSENFKVIEFYGTPGSGKTYLSNLLHNELKKNRVESNRLQVAIGGEYLIKRVLMKLWFALYMLLFNFEVFLDIFRLTKSFHNRHSVIAIKLIFNWLYILGIIQFFKKKKVILILDQGVSQALWSNYFHTNDADINSKKVLSEVELILSKLDIGSMLIINVSTDEEKIKMRLNSGLFKGTSLLNTGDFNIIKKGINTTKNVKNLLNKVSRNVDFVSISDLIN